MEEIKVCRKIEDFIGLKNGFGLKLKVENVGIYDTDMRIVLYNSKDKTQAYYKINERDILFLKEMGFKFEYIPKLSLEEVLKKYKPKPFDNGGENYYLINDKKTGIYYRILYSYTEFIGTNCYDRGTIEKILEELNI